MTPNWMQIPHNDGQAQLPAYHYILGLAAWAKQRGVDKANAALWLDGWLDMLTFDNITISPALRTQFIEEFIRCF